MEGFRAYNKTTAESSLLRYLAVTNLDFSVSRFMVRRLQGLRAKRGSQVIDAWVLTLNACAMSGVFAGLQLLRAGFVVICGARTRLL